MNHSERPLDALNHHLLKSGIVPRHFIFAPTDVVHAPLAVLSCPDDGEIAIGTHRSLLLGERSRIESKNHMNLLARIWSHQNRMLFVEHECRTSKRHRSWKIRVFNDDLRSRVKLA